MWSTIRSRKSALQSLTSRKFHLVTVRNTFIFVLCLQISSEYIPFFKQAVVYILPLSTGCLHSVRLGSQEHVEKLLSLITLKTCWVWAAPVLCCCSRVQQRLGGGAGSLCDTAGLVSQFWSSCCDSYSLVKPGLIRADRFMAGAPVVSGAAWLPLAEPLPSFAAPCQNNTFYICL